MWLLAFFDLPVETKEQRRRHTRFRKDLLKAGFAMLQYSVYGRYCGSEDRAEVHRKAVRAAVPADGEVRLLAVTDKQFGKMEVHRGKKRCAAEPVPEQLVLL